MKLVIDRTAWITTGRVSMKLMVHSGIIWYHNCEDRDVNVIVELVQILSPGLPVETHT